MNELLYGSTKQRFHPSLIRVLLPASAGTGPSSCRTARALCSRTMLNTSGCIRRLGFVKLCRFARRSRWR